MDASKRLVPQKTGPFPLPRSLARLSPTELVSNLFTHHHTIIATNPHPPTAPIPYTPSRISIHTPLPKLQTLPASPMSSPAFSSSRSTSPTSSLPPLSLPIAPPPPSSLPPRPSTSANTDPTNPASPTASNLSTDLKPPGEAAAKVKVFFAFPRPFTIPPIPSPPHPISTTSTTSIAPTNPTAPPTNILADPPTSTLLTTPALLRLQRRKSLP